MKKVLDLTELCKQAQPTLDQIAEFGRQMRESTQGLRFLLWQSNQAMASARESMRRLFPEDNDER